jgi:hypothetical protein
VVINRVRQGMLWADGPHRALPLSYGQQIVLDAHPHPLRLVLGPGYVALRTRLARQR